MYTNAICWALASALDEFGDDEYFTSQRNGVFGFVDSLTYVCGGMLQLACNEDLFGEGEEDNAQLSAFGITKHGRIIAQVCTNEETEYYTVN